MKKHLNLSPYNIKGFTLVELLVVITIIGIIMGMVLPAVNGARETARELVCTNNLSQISRAFQSHVSSQGFYPTGGWGYYWVGEPDCGYGSQQPGGWLFNILDYLEQGNVRNQGLGLSGSPRASAMEARMKNPIPIINCPTRRKRNLFPAKGGDIYRTQKTDQSFVGLRGQTQADTQPFNVTECIKGDYATNAGTFGHDISGDLMGQRMVNAVTYIYSNGCTLRKYTMEFLSDSSTDSRSGLNGISFLASEVSSDMVEDGLQNTYMVGEKYLNPEKYIVDNNTSNADNESAYDGADNDNQRIASGGPARDKKGTDWTDCFGSAHASGFRMAFCDGSVRTISYQINVDIHRNLCNRRDANKIEDWDAVN